MIRPLLTIIAVLDWLIDRVAPKEFQKIIKEHEFKIFRNAAARGCLGVINRLIEKCASDQIPRMISVRRFEAFNRAANLNQIAVVNRLLLFPSMFAHAEMHGREYNQHVQPFVQNTLATLRVNRENWEQSNPNAVFNVTDADKAKLYFYIIRYLIRSNDPNNLDHIRLLLDIPEVKDLAHTQVTPGESNELLRLALSSQNENAAALLINIPAVRELAEQHDYYRREQRGELDLARLAQNRESSMTALTTGEQKRLASAIKHYQPLLENAGVNNVMTALREELKVRYEANPAKIMVDGKLLSLPIHWQDFRNLNLNPNEKQKALEAYYQHKDHTALRYLSKPNHWMANDASYVCTNARGTEKWSTFEEYQPLIAMLFLAAQDREIPATDGYTIETRLEHFIDELAHIGRAHNWDQRRIRINSQGKTIEEEYDNLKGDKPSCFSGVKRRLFQSVQGHPLFIMLGKAIINQELNEFIRQQFKVALEERVSGEEIKAAWNVFLAELDDTPIEKINTLKQLDISPEQQTQFLAEMKKKYGDQFGSDEHFIAQIKNTLSFQEQGVTYQSHMQKFYQRVALDQLLDASSNKEENLSPTVPTFLGKRRHVANEEEDNQDSLSSKRPKSQ